MSRVGWTSVKFGNMGLLVLLLAGGLLPGCRSLGRWRPRSNFDRVESSMWRIVNGRGRDRAEGSTRDNFEVVMDAIDDPDPSLCGWVPVRLTNTSIMSGAKYGNLVDGFIDAGRDKELEDRLRCAWKRAADAGKENAYRLGLAYADLRLRQYLWTHPEIADGIDMEGYRREAPEGRGWGNLTRAGYAFIAGRLLAEGDEDFWRAWEESPYSRLYKPDP